MLQQNLTASFKTDSPKTRAYRLVSVPSSCTLSHQLITSHLEANMHTLIIIPGDVSKQLKDNLYLFYVIVWE